MEIRSLGGSGFEAVYGAFSQAFADYEMQLDKAALDAMLTRRGFDPRLSFGAFDSEQIKAFTLNGTGTFAGLPTAYDTGTGTLPSHRGQGLATRIFEYSIPHLKRAGVEQYLLEVLQHNDKAVSVYSRLGFEIRREFNYFRQSLSEIINRERKPDYNYTIEHIGIGDIDSNPDQFLDFEPSWQNSHDSILRAGDRFIIKGLFTEDTLAGYFVFEPASGDITFLAVHRQFRGRGIGSLLLGEILSLAATDTLKIINTETGCDSITGFLRSKNIEVSGRQYEMVKAL